MATPLFQGSNHACNAYCRHPFVHCVKDVAEDAVRGKARLFLSVFGAADSFTVARWCLANGCWTALECFQGICGGLLAFFEASWNITKAIGQLFVLLLSESYGAIFR